MPQKSSMFKSMNTQAKNGYTYYRESKKQGGGNLKLKDKKGLTLVEMLCTVAILVLVSMVMVLGVQLGVRSSTQNPFHIRKRRYCAPRLRPPSAMSCAIPGTLKVDGSGNVTGFFSQQFGSGDYTAFTTTPEGHVQLGGKGHSARKGVPLRY